MKMALKINMLNFLKINILLTYFLKKVMNLKILEFILIDKIQLKKIILYDKNMGVSLIQLQNS